MDQEELQYWKEEFPELEDDEIIEIIEAIDPPEPEPEPEPSIADRKQKVVDIEDYTKYW